MAYRRFGLVLRSRTFFIFLGISLILVCYYTIVTFPKEEVERPFRRQEELVAGNDVGKKEDTKTKGSGFVVDTSACKIPDMDPFDESIKDFLSPGLGYPVDCKGQRWWWTYMDGNQLFLNKTAIHESGYSLSSIHCCYRTIERVEQVVSDWDKDADNYIKYSDKCHPINDDRNCSTPISAEFIRVHCISKSPPLLNDVVYRDFFAIAQPDKDRLVSRKLYSWSKKPSPSPPNVVLIGIDNNSRMNSRRHLQKTLQLLQEIGAVEMLGYTKIAENTFVNTVPFLTGNKFDELGKDCRPMEAPQDECDYVWKRFDKAGYLTVHAEDAPYLGGFNYLKKGFLRKPTDFYLRPLMLAVMSHMPRFDYYHTDCIGRYMTDELVFKYILDTVTLGNSHSAPVFVHSWLTSLAHHNYNNIQFEDEVIAGFIKDLLKASKNTIFFFMSDHGQRYGPIRETTQGWYEDKLPTQWIYLPEDIRQQFPEWYDSLRINSARLTSHLDIYKTLLHILKGFDRKREYSELYKDFNDTSLKSRSLFTELPEGRSCEQAGITINFCACSKPSPVDVKSIEVQNAAKFAVNYLSKQVPNVCEKPKLKKVISASFLDLPSQPSYLLSFYTDPGDFLFEVNVEIKKGVSEEFVISTDFLRMNKITRPANCVNDPLLERYCYCK